jgi:hypothetical protein
MILISIAGKHFQARKTSCLFYLSITSIYGKIGRYLIVELKIKREEKTGDVNVAIEKASQRDKTRVRPQDLCKRIDSQGERAKNIVQGCDLLNSGEREEICRIIKDVQDTSKNDLSLINRSTDFIFLQQREQAIQRITDNYLEIKQMLKIAQKRDNSQALRDYLHEAMKRRVEEDFARLVGSSVSERAATDDKKIGDGLQITNT